jgi:hypothetical protein
VKLGKVRAVWEEIVVGGEANVSVGDHEALEGVEDVVLIGTTARSPMGEATASKGDDPCSHVVPDSC